MLSPGCSRASVLPDHLRMLTTTSRLDRIIVGRDLVKKVLRWDRNSTRQLTVKNKKELICDKKVRNKTASRLYRSDCSIAREKKTCGNSAESPEMNFEWRPRIESSSKEPSALIFWPRYRPIEPLSPEREKLTWTRAESIVPGLSKTTNYTNW